MMTFRDTDKKICHRMLIDYTLFVDTNDTNLCYDKDSKQRPVSTGAVYRKDVTA